VQPAVEAGAEAATPAEVEPTKLAPAETAPAASGVKRKVAPLPRVTMHGSKDVPSHRMHPTRMCTPKLQAGP
jgi:hypothetical protein